MSSQILLVRAAKQGQFGGVKATVAELHRETERLVKPVVNGHKTLVIVEQGEARAKVVPLPTRANRKKALAILRSMRGLELPPRK